MKNNLSEEDVKFRLITPSVEKFGWTKESIRMEYPFTDGQMFVDGNKVQRGKAKRADYLLLKNGTFPLAVIEAKKLEHTAEAGLQQAMNYAEILALPFAYSCNGTSFVEHDFLTGLEREFSLDEFPTEKELWQRYCEANEFSAEQLKIILFIEERTKIIAQRITNWLKENDRFSKTIVFCKNQESAERMRRALVTENSDIVKEIPNYIMKITGDDAEGKKQLDNFIEPDETPPIIATTAELLTTGVDCKTVKLIVIDKEVESIITFKQIIGKDGKLITENLIDYTRKNILGKYADLKSFLQAWNASDKKKAITDELQAEGIFLESLREVYNFDKEIDDFDLILSVAYDQKPLTRKQRAQIVQQKNYFKNCHEKCQVVISALLEKYADNGINDLENLQVLSVEPFSEIGTPKEIVNLFGGKDSYLTAVDNLKILIYQAA